MKKDIFTKIQRTGVPYRYMVMVSSFKNDIIIHSEMAPIKQYFRESSFMKSQELELHQHKYLELKLCMRR